MFIERVNNEILENKETLAQKRRIKELKKEIEYQKIKNRSVSKGKLSKDREAELMNKMTEYEKRKWSKRNDQIKQKERTMEKELQGFFKPQVSKSSKRLALKKRNKKSGIITGGKLISKEQKERKTEDHTLDPNINDSIFDRLYNESKERHIQKYRKSHNHTVCSAQDTNTMSHHHYNKSTSKSKPRKHTNPSFQIHTKASPLTSIDQLCPPSPPISDEKTRFVMNKYLYDSAKAQDNIQNLRMSKKYKSNGANSPCEFITWNESKYNSKSIDAYPELHQIYDRDVERQSKLMQPVSRHLGVKSTNSFNSGTMNSRDDTQELVKYAAPKVRHHSKNKLITKSHKNRNVLAYSLLDRSLDNTIQLLENSKRNELSDIDNCKY